MILNEISSFDDSLAHVILLRNFIRVDRRDFDEEELRVEEFLELHNVEVSRIDQRHVDGGLEIRLSANLPEFLDGDLVLEGNEIVPTSIVQRMKRKLESDVVLDPRIVSILDSDGRNVVMRIRVLLRDDGDGLLDCLHIQESVSHSGVVDLEFLGIPRITIRVLGDDEFHLRDDFLGGEIAELLEISGGAELAPHRTSTGNRNSDHPSLVAISEIGADQIILLPANGILRVEGQEGVSRFQRESILGVEEVDGAVGEVLAGLFDELGHEMSPCWWCTIKIRL